MDALTHSSQDTSGASTRVSLNGSHVEHTELHELVHMLQVILNVFVYSIDFYAGAYECDGEALKH